MRFNSWDDFGAYCVWHLMMHPILDTSVLLLMSFAVARGAYAMISCASPEDEDER